MSGEFARLAQRVDAALGDEGSADSLADVVGALGDLVGEACASEDPSRIAQLRYRVERLRARLLRAGDLDRLDQLTPALNALTRSLSAALTAVELRREGTQWEEELRVLRSRIYEALADQPARPRDLAARFDVDPAQVVRALDELEREGLVRKTRPATGDGRARVYSRVDALHGVTRLNWTTTKAVVELEKQITQQKIHGLLVVGDKHRVKYWNPPWETSDDPLGKLAGILRTGG